MKAKYTVLLKDLMENEETMKLIDKALSYYPLYRARNWGTNWGWNFPTRSWLNQRLLNHYKYREIGFETVGRFLDELKITMYDIMPYYNELFESVDIMKDLPNPFDNVDVIEEYTEKRTDSTTSSSESETKGSGHSKTTAEDETNTSASVNHNNKNVHTTTPSDTVSIPAKNIDNVTHADDVTWSKDNSSDEGLSRGESSSETDNTSTGNSKSSAKGENESTVQHTFTKKGNQGVNTYAHDMNEYRTAIIDVVNEIITDPRIADLFMKVY